MGSKYASKIVSFFSTQTSISICLPRIYCHLYSGKIEQCMLEKIPTIFRFLLLVPCTVYASFIEATIGTAVVNDATAAFHNPAALLLVKKPQLVALGTKALSQEQFIGQTRERADGSTLFGISKEYTNYNLPSGYLTFPIKKKIKLGLAVLKDHFNSDMDEPSILRYDQSTNRISNTDYILAAGLQLSKYVSIGSGVSYSAAHFTSHRITGFPNLDVPDSQSDNKTEGDNYGWNAGILIKPSKSMHIGFNYRSKVAYRFQGTSEFEGPPALISSAFDFNFWTPAHSVMTLSYFVTSTLGFITTAQWVQWSVFKNVTMHRLATQIGRNALILPSAVIPYHFQDTWIITLGGIKKITSKWVLRVAGTYNQSPGNGFYQVVSGDDIVLGASTGYQISRNLIIDASYARAFTQSQGIDITRQSKEIFGINKTNRDAISLKLTFNI